MYLTYKDFITINIIYRLYIRCNVIFIQLFQFKNIFSLQNIYYLFHKFWDIILVYEISFNYYQYE